FYIASRSKTRGVASSGEIGSTTLIIPYIDATTNSERGTELSLAPIYRGSASEDLRNSLYGAELNVAWAQSRSQPLRIDVLGGFRYLRLHEAYTLTTSSPFN